MSDIVERLRGTREWVGFPAIPICAEAADEIERLRAALKPFAAYEKNPSFQGVIPGVLVKLSDVLRAKRALAGEQEKVG